jgi:hypothetical protein
VFGPFAIYPDPHRSIMRPERQRVKLPRKSGVCIGGGIDL